jgi:hypothetical protein
MEYIRMVDGEDEMHVAEVLDIREDKRFKIKQSVIFYRFNSIRKSYYQNPIWLKPTGIFYIINFSLPSNPIDIPKKYDKNSP